MSALQLRSAKQEDILTIITILADDAYGQSREEVYSDEPGQEKQLNPVYQKAFEAIQADPNQDLCVLVDEQDHIWGTLQLTYIQYLNRKGSKRALIESVHVRADQRGKGLGNKMMQLAIERAKDKGATIIQLTSDKRRTDAHRFYRRLGFQDSHEGFKLIL